MTITTAITVSGALVFGMALGLSANLKRTVASRLDLKRPRLAGLLGLLNLVLPIGLLVAGLLVDRWSVRAVMVLGSVTLAVSLLALSEQPRYSRALLALLGADLGAAGVCAAAVVLMPHAFFQTRQGLASLQLGFAFLALGALLAPPLAGVFVHALGLRRAMAVLATLCLAPAFLVAVPSAGEIERARSALPGSLAGLVAEPSLWLMALFAFVYAPLEASFNAWIARSQVPSDPEGRGNGQGRTTGLLVGFWAAFLLSRVLTAWLVAADVVAPDWDTWGLVVLALLVLVALGNLASTTSRASTPLGILAVGLLLGPLFPTLLGMAFRRFEGERGTTLALLLAVGSLGSMLWSRFLSAGEPGPSPQGSEVIHKPPPIPWGPLALALGLGLVALVYILLA